MDKLEVLIDDIREVEGVDITCRTVKHALEVLKTMPVTHLYLDNDLGMIEPMEGIDILKWARDNDCVPPNVFLVTANPVAKERMEKVLQFDLQYNKERNWWKKT